MDNDGWVHVRRKRQGMADNKCKENDNNKSRREGSDMVQLWMFILHTRKPNRTPNLVSPGSSTLMKISRSNTARKPDLWFRPVPLKGQVNDRSFKDAALAENKSRLLNYWVGKAKNVEVLQNLWTLLKEKGLEEGEIRYDDRNEVPGRLTWVKLEGILTVANSHNSVQRIASSLGRVLDIRDTGFNSYLRNSTRVLVLTLMEETFNIVMKVKVNGHVYCVKILEDLNQPFHLFSPNSNAFNTFYDIGDVNRGDTSFVGDDQNFLANYGEDMEALADLKTVSLTAVRMHA
ncbi:hypothetical protein Tco_1471285 [Tanacetum coccineum]